MDPIQIILKDHEKIRELISQIEASLKDVQGGLDHDKKQEKNLDYKYNELQILLQKHEMMEQEFFYPVLEENKEIKPIITHLKSEERDAESAISTIDEEKDKNKKFRLIQKLLKDVSHHAKEEETKLFPKVQKLIPKDILKILGDKMERFHSKAMKMK